MSALDAQIGFKQETTAGTAVTVDRFAEFVSESITPEYGRIESNGLRPGRQFRSDTRFTTYVSGASGDVVMEVGSKGFGFWLKQMLGTMAAPVGPTDSAYTHTATPGNLTGTAFTLQVGRPFYDGASVQPFTYPGGKVASWTLANDNDSNLMATLSCNFTDEVTATALATASYPTGLETLSWAGGLVTIAGSQVDVTDISITGDNAMNTDRRYLRNNTARKEAITNDYRSGGFSLTADFENLTQRNRVASVTAAGAVATIVASWTGKALIGTSTYPSLTVTINARFDEFAANVDGPGSIEQTLTGVYLGASAISIAYVTTDATP